MDAYLICLCSLSLCLPVCLISCRCVAAKRHRNGSVCCYHHGDTIATASCGGDNDGGGSQKARKSPQETSAPLGQLADGIQWTLLVELLFCFCFASTQTEVECHDIVVVIYFFSRDDT